MAAAAESGALIATRVARSTVSNVLGKFIALGLGFLITPFVLRRLGVANYAIWVLTGSVVGYGWLLELGISGAIIKYVAEHYAKGQVEKADEVVAAALCLYCALAVCAFAIVVTAAPLLAELFHLPVGQQRTMTELVYLMGSVTALSIPCTTTTAILRGLQRYDLVSGLSAVGGVTSGALTVLVLACGGGVISLAWLALVMVLVMQVPSLWLIRRVAPELHFRLRRPDRTLIKKVLSFSSSLLVLNVAGAVQSRTDDVIIGSFLPVTLMTPFALTRRLSSVPPIFAEQFTKVLMPLTSQLYATNAETHLRHVYRVGTRLTLAILIPVGSVLVILASPILVCWVGPAFAPYSTLVEILTVAAIVDASQWTAGSVLLGMARHRILAKVAMCEGIANVTVSIVLISKLGLLGVALGILIPKVAAALVIFFYSLRVIDISWADLVEQVLLPVSIPALPTVALLCAARLTVHPGSWIATSLISLAAIAVYFLVYLAVGSGRLERELAHSLVSELWIRVRFFMWRGEETDLQI